MTEPLPGGPYDIILADPPWSYTRFSGKMHPHNREHYDRMTTEDICALPVPTISSPDAVLFLWATFPNMEDALSVVRSWGFTYKTVGFVWVKSTSSGKLHTGTGWYTRANAEVCLIGTRGRVLARHDRSVHSVILSRIGRHSQKPYEQYDRIERLFGKETRRLEMFARRRQPGWDAWGNQITEDLFSQPLGE